MSNIASVNWLADVQCFLGRNSGPKVAICGVCVGDMFSCWKNQEIAGFEGFKFLEQCKHLITIFLAENLNNFKQPFKHKFFFACTI